MYLVLLLASYLSIFAAAHRPAVRRNLIDRQFTCEVNCGNDYCCFAYTKCQASDGGFVCVDTQLTDASGQPLTWPAENPTALLSQLSSVGVTLSTNIAPKTTAPSTTAPPAAITSTIVPPASGEPRTLSTLYETRFLVTVLLSAILVGGWNWMLN